MRGNLKFCLWGFLILLITLLILACLQYAKQRKSSFQNFWWKFKRTTNIYHESDWESQFPQTNDFPVIGALTEFINGEEIIPHNYVKFLQSGGLRLIPISSNKKLMSLQAELESLNGLFLFSPPSHQAMSELVNYCERQLQNKRYFPIFQIGGIYTLLASENYLPPHLYSSKYMRAEIKHTARMFSSLAQSTFHKFQEGDYLFHQSEPSITLESLKKETKPIPFNVLMTSTDQQGVQIISAVSHQKLPIYGVQFSPERTLYSFEIKDYRSAESIEFAVGLSNFFAFEARRSELKFKNQELNSKLIENYRIERRNNEMVRIIK